MTKTLINIICIALFGFLFSCNKKSNIQPTNLPVISISSGNEVNFGEGKADKDITIEFKADGLIEHAVVTFPMQGLGISVELSKVPETPEAKEAQKVLLDGELPEKVKGATKAFAFLKKGVINDLKRGEQLFTFELIDRNGNHVWQDLIINVY
ncbi:hypothetical protein [Flammeovirga pacifica]|uniref:DUF4625 domain-containing protein n=1 Tax=Flammeovirga pacifica TaxID=915059 RepID=A0A1S1Z030_FLAPC|nr:hypothetical protein [Flammeovirga pacifica]OHX66597.1 hypothetical protein NH26_09610 [Flammeovirga pacifica]